MSDLPEPWSTWASQVGARPSMTGIGERAGLPASTISRLIKGRTTQATVEAVADALRVTPREVLEAATGESRGPWEPPLEAHLLHDDERAALNLLIQRLTAGREGGSDAGTAEPHEKSAGGNRPAPVTQLRPAARRSNKLRKDRPGDDD